MTLGKWCNNKSFCLCNLVLTRLILYIILSISLVFFNSKFAIIYSYIYLVVIVLTTLFAWFSNKLYKTPKLSKFLLFLLGLSIFTLKIVLFKYCINILHSGYNIFNLGGYDYIYQYNIQPYLLVGIVMQFIYSLICNIRFFLQNNKL